MSSQDRAYSSPLGFTSLHDTPSRISTIRRIFEGSIDETPSTNSLLSSSNGISSTTDINEDSPTIIKHHHPSASSTPSSSTFQSDVSATPVSLTKTKPSVGSYTDPTSDSVAKSDAPQSVSSSLSTNPTITSPSTSSNISSLSNLNTMNTILVGSDNLVNQKNNEAELSFSEAENSDSSLDRCTVSISDSEDFLPSSDPVQGPFRTPVPKKLFSTLANGSSVVDTIARNNDMTIREESAQITHLKNEIFRYQMRVHFLEQRSDRCLPEGLRELEEENMRLVTEKRSLEKNLEQTRFDLGNKLEKEKELRASDQQELAGLREENDLLTAELQTYKDALQQLVHSNSFQVRNGSTSGTYKDIVDIDDASDDYASQGGHFPGMSLNSAVASAEYNFPDYSSEIPNALSHEEELHLADINRTRLENDKFDLQSKLRKAQIDNEYLESELQNATYLLEELSTECVTLKEDLERAKTRNMEVEKQLVDKSHSLRDQKESLEKEIKSLESRITVLDNENETFAAELDDKCAEIEFLKSKSFQIEELLADRDDAVQKLYATRKELEKSDSEVERLLVLKDNMEADLLEATSSSHEFEHKFTEANEAKLDLERKLAEALNQLNDTKEQVSSATRSLEQEHASKNELLAQLADVKTAMTNSNDAKEREISEMTSELASLRRELETLLSEHANLGSVMKEVASLYTKDESRGDLSESTILDTANLLVRELKKQKDSLRSMQDQLIDKDKEIEEYQTNMERLATRAIRYKNELNKLSAGAQERTALLNAASAKDTLLLKTLKKITSVLEPEVTKRGDSIDITSDFSSFSRHYNEVVDRVIVSMKNFEIQHQEILRKIKNEYSKLNTCVVKVSERLGELEKTAASKEQRLENSTSTPSGDLTNEELRKIWKAEREKRVREYEGSKIRIEEIKGENDKLRAELKAARKQLNEFKSIPLTKV
ncbi:hypothetical protein CANCADRAFT_30649 [Tortispora caseinolytica NRRL Y-17796]|uniref:Centrosomin N-terminal motif 1 domain-containing protein n=1 Tax=Tortispora caseinolytica NRRL Y-17796 TaxID=767744 RepID=A0A1E4TL75_9ASCO|nr:hypothetical protein CANCADRAFT_30649 [Tortispora caseinolytica NRRL Y-17796]